MIDERGKREAEEFVGERGDVAARRRASVEFVDDVTADHRLGDAFVMVDDAVEQRRLVFGAHLGDLAVAIGARTGSVQHEADQRRAAVRACIERKANHCQHVGHVRGRGPGRDDREVAGEERRQAQRAVAGRAVDDDVRASG